MKREIYKPRNPKKSLLTLALAGLLSIYSAKAQTLETGSEKPGETPTLQLAFHEIGTLKFRLEVTRPLTLLHDNIDIFILSDDRQILHASKYSHHELRVTTFDLSTLQDGTYRFEVRSGDQRIAQLFDIKTRLKRVVLDRN
ncbi:hypothetical protein GCM10027299_40070 [Larkinella ripae]